MKNLSWTGYAVLCLSCNHLPLSAQIGSVPFGSPEVLLRHAELSVTSIETSAVVHNGATPVVVIKPPSMPRTPKNGPLEMYVRRSLVSTLDELDVRNRALTGLSVSVMCQGTYNGDSRESFLLFSKHFVLEEREGLLVIPASAFEVDLLDAVRRPALVPLFVPDIDWVTLEIFGNDGKHIDYQDSRLPTPGLAGEVRVLKEEGIVLYPTYWAASGRHGRVVFGFTQGFRQEFENANGELVDGYGVVRLQAGLYRANAKIWAVGATESYILEETTDFKDWKQSHVLLPDDFAAYLPQTSGPMKFFRARLLRVVLADASAPEASAAP